MALNKEVERLQAKLEKAEGKKAPAVKERTCDQESSSKEAGCQRKLLRREDNRNIAIKGLKNSPLCFRKTGFKVVEAERCFLYKSLLSIEYFIYLYPISDTKNMKQLCQNKHMIRFRYWSRKEVRYVYSFGQINYW